MARRFLLTYAILLGVATVGIGIWVGQQIESGVLNRTAAITALYIHSFVAPEVQSLASKDQLTPSAATSLGRILETTELGQRLVGFRVWSRDGVVLYSPIAGLTGQKFAIAGERARSFQGEVTVDISDLSDPENVFERQRYKRLVEMYVPILQNGSGQVLAVAEFYQLPNEIDAEVWTARVRSWALLLLAAVGSFLLVTAMVMRASRTIAQQQARLRDQVAELSILLSQVADLNARIRNAGSHAVAINAQERRRISADLHDGPGQALALALLQFEELRSPAEPSHDNTVRPGRLASAHAAIADALRELREIAAGLRLPELEQLSVREVIERAVHAHHRRSGTPVALTMETLPEDAPLAAKIGCYRALQETLSNATRHGHGIGVAVRAWADSRQLFLEVTDRGPGFDPAALRDGGLGVAGMRERTALVGGTFRIASSPGGTTVRLSWPLEEIPSENPAALESEGAT